MITDPGAGEADHWKRSEALLKVSQRFKPTLSRGDDHAHVWKLRQHIGESRHAFAVNVAVSRTDRHVRRTALPQDTINVEKEDDRHIASMRRR